jgi:hypothetical protein
MTNPVDPVLIVAWLVFAHLVADFVLQDDWIAVNKGRGARAGWTALGVHGSHVAVCLLPVALAFGIPGVGYLFLVALTHMLVDRWKVRATRAAIDRAQAAARARLAGAEAPAGSAPADQVPPAGLGAAWTPWPGMLFLADQALHLAIVVAGWLVLLEGRELLPAFVEVVDAVIRDWDPLAFHAAVLTGVVLVSLFLANTRGAYYLALALLSRRDLLPAPGEERDPGSPPIPKGGGTAARIAVTIAGLERLLMVALVLAGSTLGALLVPALDIAARWPLPADRDAAEVHLLGLLASASVAIVTGLAGAAALASLG